MTSPSNVVEFLLLVENLKRTKRTGWVNSGINQPESIADHMYRMSIMTMLIDDPSLDKNKCVKMALVHDLAESKVGDITPFDGITNKTKHELERSAMEEIVKLLENSEQANEMFALWQEYEDNSTPEAMLVHDIDKCEMIIQALSYEKYSFYNTTKGIFKHPQIKAWVEDIYIRRKSQLDN
ncbi:hypothetical protein H4219_000471 [Mycoemilia scoparia]|uniref:5'-deoxynucleotidase n=1 Tax=Mycoemilia scoparia TaxID=417184 RepID=A0A9W8A5W1_9FUNG|nr:hypothetical protein H4219_000471 [Mycoemilia scoparia]